MNDSAMLLTPDWPAPHNVQAVLSTRQGGYSRGVYGSLNLGEHVADNSDKVAQNRLRFQQTAKMPASPVWLQQVHGTDVLTLLPNMANNMQADAAVTALPGVVCTVMTADCLPVLLCDKAGTQVAAVHAGWRGLCNGIIEQTLAHFAKPSDVLVYLGPAISQSAFEVGEEVRTAFISRGTDAALAFEVSTNGKWHADLYLLARQRLLTCGVRDIYGGNYCTYQQSELFFSYRRDGQTGRMASSIWLT